MSNTPEDRPLGTSADSNMNSDAASQQTQFSQSSDRALDRMQREQQQATLRVQESLAAAAAAANSAQPAYQDSMAEVPDPSRFVFERNQEQPGDRAEEEAKFQTFQLQNNYCGHGDRRHPPNLYPNATEFSGESCVCCRYKQRLFVDLPRATAEREQLDRIIADLTARRNAVNEFESALLQESIELNDSVYELMQQKIAQFDRNITLPSDQRDNTNVFEEHARRYIAAGKARAPDGPPPAPTGEAGDEAMEP